MVICNAKIREQREKDKKLYSGIFNKMAENDRQVNEKNGGKWLYGWWNETSKGVKLDVDLAQVEREKQEAVSLIKANRRKENANFFKRYGGRKPNIVEVNGKPFNVNKDDEDADEVQIIPDANAEPSVDFSKSFSKHSARYRLRNEYSPNECVSLKNNLDSVN